MKNRKPRPQYKPQQRGSKKQKPAAIDWFCYEDSIGRVFRCGWQCADCERKCASLTVNSQLPPASKPDEVVKAETSVQLQFKF